MYILAGCDSTQQYFHNSKEKTASFFLSLQAFYSLQVATALLILGNF
jgi:hypothetical protein